MPRAYRIALIAFALVLLVPAATASATARMPVGFYDDNSFRWSPNVTSNLLSAQKAGASIVHVTADWSQIAPTKPSDPLNGDDEAYKLGDLDQLVRSAGQYSLQVMINISEAPGWTNGDQTPNHPPTNLNDLTNFAHMLAARYDGEPNRGLVLRWSVWNEPNLGLFLAPQFVDGKIVSPTEYAKIYMAAYKGIKAGNSHALVAIGETSNRGRNTVLKGQPDGQQSVAPATFAHLLSVIAPKLPFDAWATHPYPTSPNLRPTQKVAYPNVTLTRLNQFGTSLQQWFGRRVPIWITEYGEQTKPPYSGGVTLAQQAADAKTALQMAQASPFVEMFIWFTFRDSPATWQSGLLKSSGVKKPAYAAFSATAHTIDGQSQLVKAGHVPIVSAYVPFIGYHDPVGSEVRVDFQVHDGKKVVKTGHSTVHLAFDQSVTFSLVSFEPPAAGRMYLVTLVVSDKHGQKQAKTVALTST